MKDYDAWKLDTPNYEEGYEETLTFQCEEESRLVKFLEEVEKLKELYGVE